MCSPRCINVENVDIKKDGRMRVVCVWSDSAGMRRDLSLGVMGITGGGGSKGDYVHGSTCCST